jgi:DNA-binding GntR family transcriptional regulator
LRSRILEGHFAPDEQLSEVELARQLKISRGPIREAMQRLIQEGLLRAERNRGVFVVQLDSDDVRDIYLARGAVERAAAAIVTQQQPADALRELQRIADAIASSVDASWSDLITRDLAFHQALVRAAGSPRLDRMFHTLIAETRLCLLRLEPFYESAQEVAVEHQGILDAIVAGEADQVDHLLETHMSTSAARLSL